MRQAGEVRQADIYTPLGVYISACLPRRIRIANLRTDPGRSNIGNIFDIGLARIYRPANHMGPEPPHQANEKGTTVPNKDRVALQEILRLIRVRPFLEIRHLQMTLHEIRVVAETALKEKSGDDT